MSAIAFRQSRQLLPTSLVSSFRSSASAGSLFPSLFPAAASFSWVLPTWRSLLELFPPFLLAVPKKKTSHSRKSMRSANKGLKDKQNLVHCPGCGAPKLAHNLCPICYSNINRAWKEKSKQSID